ncbi:MAG: 2-carboxy-1,4-naphthoquinone phytyltransferase [Cyanobacteria bacterium P01_F01_bin.33]
MLSLWAAIAPSQRRLWLAAIKPPMYSVAVMPIIVGTAIAWAETDSFRSKIFVAFLFASIAILFWLNSSNDAFDAATGIDRNKPHSLANLTGRADLVLLVANLSLVSGLSSLGAIAWWQRDFTVLAVIALCCALGYAYQGPPFRWGYRGWGEPICFVTFGPLAVEAAYYSQTQSWSWVALWASGVVGVATTLILFCSHFHQLEDDAAAGKRSPIVQLGTARAAQLVPWMAGTLFALTGLGIVSMVFPWQTAIVGLSFPPAWKLNSLIRLHHANPARVNHSKFIAVSLHFWSCALLGVGFALSRL